MVAHENKVLESLGKLSGLVEASREDIKQLVTKQDEQTKNIQDIAMSVKLMQNDHNSTRSNCDSKFEDINSKLARDYETLNVLRNDAMIQEGVEEYKGKKREWWQYVIGLLVAASSILFGINQVTVLKNSIKASIIIPNNAGNASAADATNTKDTITRVILVDSVKTKGK